MAIFRRVRWQPREEGTVKATVGPEAGTENIKWERQQETIYIGQRQGH